MSEQDMWAAIPHGKKDPPMLLWDMSKPLTYDFNDPDTQYVMFNRKLEGCVTLPFTKSMDPSVPGCASVDGKPVYCTVQPIKLGGFDAWWLCVKLGGLLYEYGKSVTVQISGFRDTDGNEMLPAALRLENIPKAEPTAAFAEHERIALQAAQDGIVLLKNENSTLPLKPDSVINFFGKGLYEFRICAVGAGKIYPRYAVGLLEAARKETGIRLNEELLSFYAQSMENIPGAAILSRAREQSDTAVMVISRPSGENTDNTSGPGEYRLTKEEDSLLKTLRGVFNRIVVILNVGYPIDLTFAETYAIDALVYSGFGGMLAGQALMDVLMGRVNPSGKLPDTWSMCYDSIPSSRNFYDCADGKQRLGANDGDIWIDTVYEEDIYVGYRYFETFPQADRRGYPFGHGLSYTTFDIQCEKVAKTPAGLEAIVTVCNTGSVPGREVVQLYLSKPQGKLEQPARELVFFEKTKLLAPEESQSIRVAVPNSRMTSFDTDSAAYVLVAGRYTLYLGGSVRDARKIGGFTQDTQETIKQVTNRMTPNTLFHCLRQAAPEETYPRGKLSGVRENAKQLEPKRPNREHFSHAELPKTNRHVTFQDVLGDNKLIAEFVGNMSVSELARIAVCASDGWGMEGRGEAGRLFQPNGLQLPSFVVADGNSGVNLRTRNIGMPSGVTLCASFDRILMEQVGRVIGEEAKALDIDMILAPALNLHRNPLNGRHPEYFSEDPYLAGSMAGNYCKGLESTGVGGCYKHLICNNAESSRKRNQSILSERAIRELYFRAFEYALEEHESLSVMTAYNAVNGVFTSCDSELIQGMLFGECGFRGFVMTDWSSYDSADVAEMEMAGNTWITPGSMDDTYTKRIEEAVENGRLPLAQLQDNVLRMLRVLIKLKR